MKSRRVFVTLEIETDAPISAIKSDLTRSSDCIIHDRTGEQWKAKLHQFQANVIKERKAKRRGKAKA